MTAEQESARGVRVATQVECRGLTEDQQPVGRQQRRETRKQRALQIVEAQDHVPGPIREGLHLQIAAHRSDPVVGEATRRSEPDLGHVVHRNLEPTLHQPQRVAARPARDIERPALLRQSIGQRHQPG